MNSFFSWRTALGVLLLGLTALAQETPDVGPTADEIRARLEGLAGAEGEAAAAQREIYTQALAELAKARESRSSAEGFAQQAAEAPALLESLQAELAKPADTATPERPPQATVAELEASQRQAESELESAQRESADLTRSERARSERRPVIAQEIDAARKALAETADALATSQGTEPEQIARRSLLTSQRAALEARIASLEAELAMFDARRQTLALRKDRAARRVARAELVARFWQAETTAARQREAQDAAQLARERSQQLAGRYPDIAAFADRNQELAALRTGEAGRPARIRDAKAEAQAVKSLVGEIEDRFDTMRRRVAAGGLTEGMAQTLRRDFEWLPVRRSMEVAASANARQLSESQLELIDFEEERALAGDIAGRRAELLADVPEAERTEELETLVTELVSTRRDQLDNHIRETKDLIETLVEMGRAQEELALAAEDYREYIGERILWVRSTSREPLRELVQLPRAVIGFLSETDPRLALEGLGQAAKENLGRSVLLILVLMALLGSRLRCRRYVLESSDLVRRYRTDRYSYTLRAFACTIVLAAPGPVALYALSWLMTRDAQAVATVQAMGIALAEVGSALFVIEMLRQVAISKHVGEVHFRWPGEAMKSVRRAARNLKVFLLPLAFVALTYDAYGNVVWSSSVGRAAYMAALAVLAFQLHRLLKPNSPLVESTVSRGQGLLSRTYRLWYIVAVGAPLALLVLAGAGYYYAALEFEEHLRDSVALGIGILFLSALLNRWLFVLRRRLVIEQARQRSEAKAEGEKESIATESGAMTTFDEESVDIPAVDAQTRQMIRAGLLVTTLLGFFLIWSQALPALRALERVHLWPKLQVISTEELEAEPTAASPAPMQEAAAAETAPQQNGQPLPVPALNPTEEAPKPQAGVVTLRDVALALVIVLLTLLISKNVVGFLELALLQRLPMESGTRNAVTTICRYLVLFIGLASAFNVLGLGWNKIQWLAAALTFGLAFGLQEIFANFVSGIIILLERPIRVGDIVTVSGTEGRVTRLRMRATTIMDWDRREMLVPNKEFITSQVINWTLSDPITRIIIPVGIAYGSDVQLAHEILADVAAKNPLVLKDPAPRPVFLRFGESSLDFELRIFVGSRDVWPEVMDRMHTEIDAAFRRAKIEIAFPQRDLHLRSAVGVRVEAAGGGDQVDRSG